MYLVLQVLLFNGVLFNLFFLLLCSRVLLSLLFNRVIFVFMALMLLSVTFLT